MIKSFVVTPYFLDTAKEDHALSENLYKFSLLHKEDSFKEVLFLVVDNNSDFIKKYKDIVKQIGGKNLRLKFFVEDFILKLKREKANINNKNLKIDIFFNDASDLEKIPKIDPQPYISFPISENKLKDVIQNLTQFAKKITIFDPYISQHMTNYSKTGIKQINNYLKNINIKNSEKFKISIQDNQSYKYSLREILNFILLNKKENNLQIKILSTIRKDDKKNFLEIIKKIQNEILENNKNKEKLQELLFLIKSELYDKQNNSIVAERIKSVISKCFLDFEERAKIEFDLINEWKKEGKENRKFYKKGFLIEGDDDRKVVVDFGQGLNLFSKNVKKTRIRINGNINFKIVNKYEIQNNPEYQIRVITNKAEKHKYSSITRFLQYADNTNNIPLNS